MTDETTWKVDQSGEGTKIKDAGGNTVLWTQHTHLRGRRTDAEVRAIADLAAAAPDMLDALKAAVSQVHLTDSTEPMSPDVKRVFDQCCYAIAKAEGGPK